MFICKTLHQLYSPGPETIPIPKKLVGGYPYPVLADQTGAVGADTAGSDEQVNINHIPQSPVEPNAKSRRRSRFHRGEIESPYQLREPLPNLLSRKRTR